MVTGGELSWWAWEAADYRLREWLAAIPEDHEVHDMDILGQLDAFFEAHKDGWEPHPDQPPAVAEAWELMCPAFVVAQK